MPANLSPEYKAAESAFKKASDPRERLQWLREMLRTVPKHKGTEHLQADIKTRIKHLTEELESAKRGPARSGPALVIRPEGAAQVAIVGAPNVGKSSLHARLTGSRAEVGAYPYTTLYPQPGMLPYGDIQFQLVDLPPVSREHPLPWIANALQPADACLLVADLTQPDCVEATAAVLEELAGRRITLVDGRAGEAPAANGGEADEDEGYGDPFAVRLPALLVATRADLNPEPQAELAVLQELLGTRYPAISVSAETGPGLEHIGAWLFESLQVVRVYTKAPGRPPDKERPYTVRRGDTVGDVAALVHKDLAAGLKYARLWRAGGAEGLQVSRDEPVADGDILELHT